MLFRDLYKILRDVLTTFVLKYINKNAYQPGYALNNIILFKTIDSQSLSFSPTDISVEVLSLQEISKSLDSETMDLQCIIKTCATNPTVAWQYYPHGSSVSSSSLTSGKIKSQNKCHIQHVLKQHGPGFYVCEATIEDGSYAYKVVEVSKFHVFMFFR